MSRIEIVINRVVIIALSFVMFLSGLGLIVAGIRTRKKIWNIYGLVYIGVGWILMSIGLISVYLIMWAVSIIHTVIMSKEYCLRLKVIKESKDILRTKEHEQAKKFQQDIYKELIGEIESDENDVDEIQRIVNPIDINNCKESELIEIPGISLILAKRIVDVRKEVPFSSVEDFYMRLSIDKNKAKRMEEYLLCSEKTTEKEDLVKNETKDAPSRASGRKIDI
ncbi:ComEA family DNA-binding protein [Luxibacter massiliensis]|uniref:ComEA family DNA-binding protein n=1 Tax=Luxibacter massiliensis TaxID=2219695 RepID=UPI000F0592FA|nr:helix-hairpin-helix domain-containing protein [Luxibacter massiliensis]